MAKWNPGRVIERHARKLQAAALRALRSASPPVPHRATRDATRPSFRAATLPGGSLVAAVAKRDLVVAKPWGAVVQWFKLGQKFLWFTQGTSHQKARPVTLAPNVAELRRDLEADAVKHFTGSQARGR